MFVPHLIAVHPRVGETFHSKTKPHGGAHLLGITEISAEVMKIH